MPLSEHPKPFAHASFVNRDLRRQGAMMATRPAGQGRCAQGPRVAQSKDRPAAATRVAIPRTARTVRTARTAKSESPAQRPQSRAARGKPPTLISMNAPLDERSPTGPAEHPRLFRVKLAIVRLSVPLATGDYSHDTLRRQNHSSSRPFALNAQAPARTAHRSVSPGAACAYDFLWIFLSASTHV